MEGFDHAEILYSANFVEENVELRNNFLAHRKKFKEFLRQFHEGNFNYKYRDNLKKNYNLKQYWLEVNIEDLASYDESLAEKIYKEPTEYLPIFEEAATEVVDELTTPRAEDQKEVEDIQILLTNDANATPMRGMKPESVAKLIKISGIIISASAIKAKAIRMAIQCRSCRNVVPNIKINPGLEGYAMPRKCTTEQAGRPKCPLDPYFIMPDKCKCVDYQMLKLQELPDQVPQGEMPRHTQLFCERYLCDRVVPGNRVMVLGILSIKKIAKTGGRGGNREKALVGIRSSYIRIVGICVDGDNKSTSTHPPVTAEEIDSFKRLAADPDVYEKITRSIAPSIYGAEDMKKAIACLLFGGSRKRLPDGLTRRGDINVLMVGDPGTAKSQLLKFVENASPIGVYTSGKGSSAAGLTASVTRDTASRTFVMEGGAMVLADGGVVCIDEFDKMKEDDRVAIHEAMEQQTISIAKAGITTTLNTRCSVLAAANSIFGRWDETKGEENIDFMPTILSRFDMIFIVKDEHIMERDIHLAKFVIGIHANADNNEATNVEGELPLKFLKKYVHYCRTHCGPRLTEEAGEKLKNRYVMMRTSAHEHEKGEKKLGIPITVRQLEAVIRISESLAKMRLLPFANEVHVDEALRLFQVSTMNAATSGALVGAEGFTSNEDHEKIAQIERQLKKRFGIGTQVSEKNIVSDFVKQKYDEQLVMKVIYAMIRRGQLQHRLQRKMLYRIF